MKRIEEIKKYLEVEELNKIEQDNVHGGLNAATKRNCKCKGEGCSGCPNSKKDWLDDINLQ